MPKNKYTAEEIIQHLRTAEIERVKGDKLRKGGQEERRSIKPSLCHYFARTIGLYRFESVKMRVRHHP